MIIQTQSENVKTISAEKIETQETMPRRTINFIICLSVIVLSFSCDNNRVYDAYLSTNDRWHKDSILSFTFKAPDTTKAYNLFINLRNNHSYAYSNLYLITTLTYPHGKAVRDTLEYKMAAPNGALLGSGFSDLKENKLWYKGHLDNFVFSESGDYTLEVQHAMRDNGAVNGMQFLEGVSDIGFRIEHKE